MTLQPGDRVEGTVEKVVFQGRGLLRINGCVVFVEGVIAGEQVVVEIQEKKKSYCVGKLVSIIQQTKERRKPLCSHFGACAGCQLQHMKYPVQVACKTRWVEEFASHKARFSKECKTHDAPHEYEYRRKISLRFVKTKAKTIFGYVAKDNVSLFEITECPIIYGGSQFLKALREFLNDLSFSCSGTVSATVLHDKTFIVHFRFFDGNVEALKNVSPHALWKALRIDIGHMIIEKGPLEVEEPFLGITTCLAPKIFVQNYPEMSAKLYEEVVSRCTEETLELYAGIGIMSMLLSQKKIPATAVEINPHSEILFKKMQKKNNLLEGKFVVSPVERFLQKQKRLPNTWILNPPRTGLTQQVISAIEKHAPKSLFYISCMPSTLMRDIEKLPYQIKELHVYDMFPQTTHVETLAILQHINRQ